METDEPNAERVAPRPDVALTAARAAAGAIAVAAIAFGLWRVRDLIVLLLLALTFAAAMRPGVEWLRSRRVHSTLAILSLFILVFGIFSLFFWLAVPPALHELERALTRHAVGSSNVEHSTGIRH